MDDGSRDQVFLVEKRERACPEGADSEGQVMWKRDLFVIAPHSESYNVYPLTHPLAYLLIDRLLIFIPNFFFPGHVRTSAHVTSMRPTALCHASHLSPLELVIPRSTLPTTSSACFKPFQKTYSLLCPVRKSASASLLVFATKHAQMEFHEPAQCRVGIGELVKAFMSAA